MQRITAFFYFFNFLSRHLRYNERMAPNSATKAIIRVAMIKGDGKVPILTSIGSPFVAL